jgi:hypothetical protein
MLDWDQGQPILTRFRRFPGLCFLQQHEHLGHTSSGSPVVSGGRQRCQSTHTTRSRQKHDRESSALQVLCSNHFFSFDDQPVELPETLRSIVKPGPGHTSSFPAFGGGGIRCVDPEPGLSAWHEVSEPPGVEGTGVLLQRRVWSTRPRGGRSGPGGA